MAWLVCDGTVLASTDVSTTRHDRRRGLLGRHEIPGALVPLPCRQVHTVEMRLPIDVVWCARIGQVLRTSTRVPNRVSRMVWRARFVIEAEAGEIDRWALRTGDVVELVP